VIGETVGSYRVTRVLGEGGMGRVYLGEHTLIGKRAAIKVLLPHFSTNPDVVKRFFNEARSSSLLKHPGVVDIYDFGRLPNGSAFIIMELLDGESLSDCLRRVGRLGHELLVDVARQVANALGAAHERGIVHRDLKPDNIFLLCDSETRSGVRVKILDFGVAKLADLAAGGKGTTRTGAIIGTPTYMSPEQCRGAGHVDQRSDIYSLGCVMFEMATGRVPFPGVGPGEVIAAQLYQAPPSLGDALPPPVMLLIERMLAKSPDERVQSMAEVVQALGAVDSVALPATERMPTLPVPPPSPPTTLGGASGEMAAVLDAGPRRLRRVAIVAVTTAAVLGGGAVVWRVRSEATATATRELLSPATGAKAVAPAPPAPRHVSVRIVSQPAGAEVYRVLDGVRIGRTPWQGEFAVSDGEAVFRLRARGYHDAELSVPLEVDAERSVALEKIVHKATPPTPAPSPAPSTTPPATPPAEAKPNRSGLVDPWAN
jgi:serine/threonine-protein kinase